MRFPDPQDNESQHGQEVERVTRDAVEGDERGELADENVRRAEQCVEHHGVDGREAQAAVVVADGAAEGGAEAAALADAVADLDGAGHADAAEDGGEEAFVAGGVDEAAGGEGGGVEGAKAGGADGEGEGEGAEGAEDGVPEGDGDGGGVGDGGEGEDEEVGDIGEEVGEDDEGHGGVDDAGEVAVGVEEFARNVVCLRCEGKLGISRERKKGSGEMGEELYIVPTVVGPQTSVEGDGPIGGRAAGAFKPAVRLPVFVWRALPCESCRCDNDSRDCNAEQRYKLQKHEHVPHPHSQLRRKAIEQRDQRQARQSNSFINPCTDVLCLCTYSRSNSVLSEYYGYYCCRTGLQDKDRTP
jgi:hypothetical protein